MEIIERFYAATSGRRIWAGVYALTGLAVVACGVWAWDLPWTVPAVVLGVVIVVCSISQELYQQRLGTVGLIAVSIIIAAVVVTLLAVGMLSWRLSRLVGPALCLGGAVFLWRDRPTDRQRYLVPARASKYIAKVENYLRRIKPQTPFHAALGRSFLGQVDQAATWLAEAYDDGAREFPVTALFVEMNRFDANTDQWFLDGMVFKIPPSELFDDLWYNLGDYESACEDQLVLTGMEDLQAAFKQADEDHVFASEAPEDQHRLQAMSDVFELITLRMHELIAAAHREANRRGHPVGGIRIFANAHDTPWCPLCSPGGNRETRDSH